MVSCMAGEQKMDTGDCPQCPLSSLRQLFLNGFLNKAVQALLVHNGIHGRAPVGIAVFKADIQAAFIGDLRGCSLLLTGGKVLIHRFMEIRYQLGRIGSLIGDQGTDTLDLSVKHAVILGEFHAADITFIFHRIFHIHLDSKYI